MEKTANTVTVTESVMVKTPKKTKKRKSVETDGKREDDSSKMKKQKVKGSKKSKKKD